MMMRHIALLGVTVSFYDDNDDDDDDDNDIDDVRDEDGNVPGTWTLLPSTRKQ